MSNFGYFPSIASSSRANEYAYHSIFLRVAILFSFCLVLSLPSNLGTSLSNQVAKLNVKIQDGGIHGPSSAILSNAKESKAFSANYYILCSYVSNITPIFVIERIVVTRRVPKSYLSISLNNTSRHIAKRTYFLEWEQLDILAVIFIGVLSAAKIAQNLSCKSGDRIGKRKLQFCLQNNHQTFEGSLTLKMHF